METLYTKTIEKIEVELCFKSENNRNYWQIYSKNSSRSQLIGEYVKESENNILFKSYGDIRKQVIIGDIAINKNKLYIVMYRFDAIYLSEYVFLDDEKYECNEYYIGKVIRGSYLNFGDPAFRAQSKLYNNNV